MKLQEIFAERVKRLKQDMAHASQRPSPITVAVGEGFMPESLVSKHGFLNKDDCSIKSIGESGHSS